MDTERINVALECRASESGPMLHLTVLQEGRAATGARRELFAPGSTTWPAEGIGVLTEHLAQPEVRAVPTREADGRIVISAPASPSLFAAVEGGKRYASVEFYALEERTTQTGVREVLRALVTGATVTDRPEYDTTRAEVRERTEAPLWL